MMCPDDGAVDHVGGRVALGHFCQRFEHRIEHASLNPSSVAAKDAVPFAIFVGEVSPLCPSPRHSHHAFVVETVILRQSTTASALRRQQWPDQCPLVVQYANTLAQSCLPKDSLESTSESHVNLCPRNLAYAGLAATYGAACWNTDELALHGTVALLYFVLTCLAK